MVLTRNPQTQDTSKYHMPLAQSLESIESRRAYIEVCLILDLWLGILLTGLTSLAIVR